MNSANAQNVLLSQDVDTNTINHRKWGPNDPHYIGYSLTIGLPVGASDARLPLAPIGSYDVNIEVYYKQKISGLLSTGISLGYRSSIFRLKQMAGYTLTDSLFWHADVSHKREKITVYALTARAFLRFNFDPHRGDNLGKYLEIGAGPDVNFMRSYEAMDIQPDKIHVRTKFTNLPYFTYFPAYTYALLKSGGLGIGLQYRLSPYFEAEYALPDLPRYMIMLRLGK